MSLLRNVLAVFVAIALAAAGTAHAQCALPYTLTNGQPPDATKVMANFNALISCFAVGGSTNSIQYNGGSGALAGVGPLTNGQVLIGSTGNPPQAATLTAGAGIVVTAGPGTITIGGPTQASAGLYRQVMSPLPTAASTGLTSWLNQGTATVADTPVGVSITSVPRNAVVGRFVTAPGAPYTVRTLLASTTSTSGASTVGLGFYDGTAKLQMITFGPGSGLIPSLGVVHWVNPTTFGGLDAGVNNIYFSQPIWLQVQDDGTNVSFGFSQDGVSFINVYSVAKSSGYLGSSGYSNVVFLMIPSTPLSSIGTVMSWIVN